ncbi:hypothetical protein [Pararhizobium sp.]|uniref:hypothetical protein n=1 Tax=Pararhizobium sp. TaxID=1977563 RepID=UPI003BAA7333
MAHIYLRRIIPAPMGPDLDGIDNTSFDACQRQTLDIPALHFEIAAQGNICSTLCLDLAPPFSAKFFDCGHACSERFPILKIADDDEPPGSGIWFHQF